MESFFYQHFYDFVSFFEMVKKARDIDLYFLS